MGAYTAPPGFLGTIGAPHGWRRNRVRGRLAFQ